jgi:hypothetical protein
MNYHDLPFNEMRWNPLRFNGFERNFVNLCPENKNKKKSGPDGPSCWTGTRGTGAPRMMGRPRSYPGKSDLIRPKKFKVLAYGHQMPAWPLAYGHPPGLHYGATGPSLQGFDATGQRLDGRRIENGRGEWTMAKTPGWRLALRSITVVSGHFKKIYENRYWRSPTRPPNRAMPGAPVNSPGRRWGRTGRRSANRA